MTAPSPGASREARKAAEAAYERLSYLSEEDLVEEIGGKTGAHSLDYMNNLAMFMAGAAWGDASGYQRGIRDAAEERDLLRELVSLKDQLLACYRVGKRPSDKLLDGLHRVQEQLRKLAPQEAP
jgi:hypothetical protein